MSTVFHIILFITFFTKKLILQGGSKRMDPLEIDFKQSLDLYFQIYQGQLLSLTFIDMIISDNHFSW